MMKIIVNERPKNSSECILDKHDIGDKKYLGSNEVNSRCCDGNCAECKYIQTINELDLRRGGI